MKAPIYVYYALDKFYQVLLTFCLIIKQNHRRFVQSRSDNQLLGDNVKDSELDDDCDPLAKAPNGKYYWPCGLAAQSFFNGILYYIILQTLLN